MSSGDHEAIIIGGGQSGLATAYYLLRAGVHTLVLDDQPAPGGTWLHVWPSMTLFSTAEFSNLPGWPMPLYDGFPPAHHVVFCQLFVCQKSAENPATSAGFPAM